MNEAEDNIVRMLKEGAPGDDIRAEMRRIIEDSEANEKTVLNLFSPLLVMKYMTIPLFVDTVHRLVRPDGSLPAETTPVIESAFRRYGRHHEDAVQLAVLLVADDNGHVRQIGRNIWDDARMEEKVKLPELSSELQIRVAVSLLQDMINPEKRLPVAMPMLNSPCKDLRTILVKLLELYILNYWGTFREVFVSTSLEENEEVKHLRAFMEEVEQHFEYAGKCMELHSEYAYPAEWEICQQKVSEYLSEAMRKTQKMNMADSFLSKVTHIQLARGGGMRTSDGQVQPLAEIAFSSQLPCFMAAYSPKEEAERYRGIYDDWSKIGAK